MEERPIDLTKKIAEFIDEINAADIPDYAYEHAKVCLLDWLSVTLAAKDDPLVLKLIQFAHDMGGHEHATILGHGIKKSVTHAALINGAASHALDYDDTLGGFIGHPSVTIFPALLALCEWKGLSGRDFLVAYLTSIQAGVCIGVSSGVEHYMAGWHATSTLGHLASAAGCAKLLGLDIQRILYALGIAGTQASGLKRVFGTMCKPFHAGKSSMAGLMSALLAENGFTSAEDILEGTDGFFQLFKGKASREHLEKLGKSWDVENMAQKYHASCHATHSPIEAALVIKGMDKFNADDITKITINCTQIAFNAAGKLQPKTGLEGKFSVPYCVVNAILTGKTGMQGFTDNMVNNQKVRELLDKTSMVLDENLQGMEARVIIETNSGETFSKDFNVMNEIPDLDTKRVKLKAKFLDLTAPVVGDGNALKLLECIMSIETLSNMNDMIKLIQT